jgi:hypothetical protein
VWTDPVDLIGTSLFTLLSVIIGHRAMILPAVGLAIGGALVWRHARWLADKVTADLDSAR